MHFLFEKRSIDIKTERNIWNSFYAFNICDGLLVYDFLLYTNQSISSLKWPRFQKKSPFAFSLAYSCVETQRFCTRWPLSMPFPSNDDKMANKTHKNAFSQGFFFKKCVNHCWEEMVNCYFMSLFKQPLTIICYSNRELNLSTNTNAALGWS